MQTHSAEPEGWSYVSQCATQYLVAVWDYTSRHCSTLLEQAAFSGLSLLLILFILCGSRPNSASLYSQQSKQQRCADLEGSVVKQVRQSTHSSECLEI